MKRYIYETDFIDDEDIMLGVSIKDFLTRQKEIEIENLLDTKKDDRFLVFRIDKELSQAIDDLSEHLGYRVSCPDAYFPIYHDVLLKGNHVGIGFVWRGLGKYPLIWSDIPIAGLSCLDITYPVILND